MCYIQSCSSQSQRVSLGLQARFPGHRWDDAAMFKFDLQALSAIPIVVFGFNCHANVVTIMSCALPAVLSMLPADQC